MYKTGLSGFFIFSFTLKKLQISTLNMELVT
jgi:hypothetical protein